MTRRRTRRPLNGGVIKGKTIILAAPVGNLFPAVLTKASYTIELAGVQAVGLGEKTPTFVGATTSTWGGSTSGNNTISLTALTGGADSVARVGDIVFALYGTRSSADRSLSITDGVNDYTLIGEELYRSWTPNSTNMRFAYKVLTEADTTVIFGPTGNSADEGVAAVYVWRNIDTNAPFNVPATYITNSGSGGVNPPAITPTLTGSRIICAGVQAGTYVYALTATGLSNFVATYKTTVNDGVGLGIGTYKDWTSDQYDCDAWGGGALNQVTWGAVTVSLSALGGNRLTPSKTYPITGVSSGGTSAGTMGVGVKPTSVSCSSSTGTFTISVVRTLTGTQATGSAGVEGVAIALNGAEGAGTAGTLTLDTPIQVALSGVQATGTVGAVGTGVGLTGATSTGSSGTLGIAPALSGVSATGATGSPVISAALTNVVGTGQQGSFGISVGASVALTNVLSTGSTGTFGTGRGLTTVVGTGATGVTPVTFSIGLTNVLATGFAGVEGTGTGVTGTSGTAQIGTLGVSSVVVLSGAPGGSEIGGFGTGLALVGGTASGFVGDLSPALADILVGDEGTGFAGQVGVAAELQLVGGTATGLNGSPGVTFELPLEGVAGVGDVGTVVLNPITEVLLDGLGLAGEVGTLGSEVGFGLPGTVATAYAGLPVAGIEVGVTGDEGTAEVGTALPGQAYGVVGGQGIGETGLVHPSQLIEVPGVGAVGLVGVFVPTAFYERPITGVGTGTAVGTVLPFTEFPRAEQEFYVVSVSQSAVVRPAEALDVCVLLVETSVVVHTQVDVSYVFAPEDDGVVKPVYSDIRVAA